MKYLSVHLVCQLQQDGCFCAYKGSMLRGVLGSSLRRAVCMTQKQDCFQCLLGKTCVFPRLFTAASAPAGGSGTAPWLPPPFCIEPPRSRQIVYASGETFSFQLKLFSYATEYLPYFIHAFTLAGKRGMGRGAQQGQGAFRIADILQDGTSVYDAKEQLLHGQKVQELHLPELKPNREESTLECRLTTPLRFKSANHLSTSLDFSTLLLLMIRRLKSLYALDGQTFCLPSEEFLRLRETASRVRTGENELRWEDWTRYSGRQQTVMQLGGLTGRIVYQGPVSAFTEYLNFASQAHLGKQSSFGLGAIDLRW